MKEERMFILTMLNEGKINSDEACRLLAALKPEKNTPSEIGEKVNKYAKTVKNKVTKIAKDAEPTVKKCADAVGEKLEDIKHGILNRGSAEGSDDDIIIDETEKSEQGDNDNDPSEDKAQ